MGLDFDKLFEQLLKLKEHVENGEIDRESKENFKQKYTYLWRNTPMLFDLIFANEPDTFSVVEMMFRNARAAQGNPEALESGTAEISELVIDRYIIPVVDNLKQE